MSIKTTYMPSGKVTPLGIVLGLVVGLGLALVLAWPYQKLISVNPFVYVNIIASAIYGGLVGGAVGIGMQWGKGRNVPVAMLLAAVCCVGAWYVSLRVDYTGISDARQAHDDAPARLIPSGITIGGNGIILAWLIELGTLVVCGAAVAKQLVGQPFCEKCDCWMAEQGLGVATDIDDNAISGAVSFGETDLSQAIQLKPGSGYNLAAQVHQCPTCQDSFLTLTLIWKEEKGEKSRPLVKYGSLGAAEAEAIRVAIAPLAATGDEKTT